MKILFIKFIEFYYSKFLILFSLYMAVFFALITYLKHFDRDFSLLYFYGLFFLILVVIWFLPEYARFRFIKSRGKKRPGKIVQVSPSQSGCYLVWEYDYQGQIYRTSVSTLKNRSEKFSVGQNVLVTLEPGNPQNSILEENYQ